MAPWCQGQGNLKCARAVSVSTRLLYGLLSCCCCCCSCLLFIWPSSYTRGVRNGAPLKGSSAEKRRPEAGTVPPVPFTAAIGSEPISSLAAIRACKHHTVHTAVALQFSDWLIRLARAQTGSAPEGCLTACAHESVQSWLRLFGAASAAGVDPTFLLGLCSYPCWCSK